MSTGLTLFFAFAVLAAIPETQAAKPLSLDLMRTFQCDRYAPASGMIRSIIRTPWSEAPVEEATIHFEDHGARQALFVTKRLSEPRALVALVDRQTIIQFDPATKKGVRSTFRLSAGTVAGCTMLEFDRPHSRLWRFAQLPPRMLLGHEAAGRSAEGKHVTFNTWSWGNIPLYVENKSASGGAIMTLEVIELQLGPQPPALFEIPPDLEIEPAKLPGLPRAGP